MTTGNSISTHVLDTALGVPASGVGVVLERLDNSANETPVLLGASKTDDDGRLRDFLQPGTPFSPGRYRLRFDVGDYFARTARQSLYPEIVVLFTVNEVPQHYHIPLLLSPFGYSTYRGS